MQQYELIVPPTFLFHYFRDPVAMKIHVAPSFKQQQNMAGRVRLAWAGLRVKASNFSHLTS